VSIAGAGMRPQTTMRGDVMASLMSFLSVSA